MSGPVRPPCPSRHGDLSWSRLLPESVGLDDPAEAVREGFKSDGQGDFEQAPWQVPRQPENSSTRETLARPHSRPSTRRAPATRKGDLVQAREWYLKAGLCTRQ